MSMLNDGSWPFYDNDSPCACCGHAKKLHKEGECHGKPIDPQAADADGECPCNGFEFKQEQPS